MTFSIYIRALLETNQFLIISSINELYHSNTNEYPRIISFFFAILILILYMWLVGFKVYLACSNYKIIENDHNKLSEFFTGIKNSKSYMYYPSIKLIRKMLFIVILLVSLDLSSKIVILILCILQFAYLIYALKLRPYKDAKDNIIEILNELYFLSLLASLIFLNSIDDWST